MTMLIYTTSEGNQGPPDDTTSTGTYGPTEAEGYVLESYPLRVFVASVCFTVFVVGTIGNSLTILAVLVTRKLQNATNTFVINLAVSDLLSCIFLPWSIVGLLIRGDWPGQLSLACTFAGGMLSLSLGCSFYTLASIALERLILITYPRHTYHNIFSTKILIIWVALIWIIPFSFVILPPVLGIGALGFNPKYRTCSDISEGYHPNASQTFDYIQAAGVFPVPLLILIVSYSRIVYYVWYHSKKFVTREVPIAAVKKPVDAPVSVVPSSSSSSTDTAVAGEKRKSRKVSVSVDADTLEQSQNSGSHTLKRIKTMSRRELRVTKNLFLIFCAFMICLFPYIICLIFDDSDPAIPFTFSLLIVNSCINPIIYALRFPNFKLVFKFMVKCQWYSIPEPSWLLRRLKCGCRCCSAQYA